MWSSGNEVLVTLFLSHFPSGVPLPVRAEKVANVRRCASQGLVHASVACVYDSQVSAGGSGVVEFNLGHAVVRESMTESTLAEPHSRVVSP